MTCHFDPSCANVRIKSAIFTYRCLGTGHIALSNALFGSTQFALHVFVPIPLLVQGNVHLKINNCFWWLHVCWNITRGNRKMINIRNTRVFLYKDSSYHRTTALIKGIFLFPIASFITSSFLAQISVSSTHTAPLSSHMNHILYKHLIPTLPPRHFRLSTHLISLST